MTAGHELIGSLRAGSAIVEMAFALAGIPLQVTDIPYGEKGPGRDRMLALNPLGQVPVLVLPDGTVMTESAAMVLYLDGLAPAAGLLPPVGDAARPAALNQVVMLVAAVYPTVTFSDSPQDYTLPGPAADALRDSMFARKQALWQRFEAAAAPAPFLAGARPGAYDLYTAVMTQWRPGPEWFAAHTPRLAGIGAKVAAVPALAGIMARHFPRYAEGVTTPA